MGNVRFVKFFLPVLALVLIFPASCRSVNVAQGKINVAVSISPQEEFVRAVGGDRVYITLMVPPGANPHTYEPKPDQITALAKVKMYARVGADLEFELAWMDKLISVNRQMLVVDCSQGVQLMAEDEQARLVDPHIWMSPVNTRNMVRNITDGLVQIDPDNRSYYEQNRDDYIRKLAGLDQKIRADLAGITNRRFIIYHPVLGYFAREYNLTEIAVEREGKEPTPARISEVIDQAKMYNIKVIFNTPQYNPRNAEIIASEIGGRVVTINDLAANYHDNMQSILSELLAAMR